MGVERPLGCIRLQIPHEHLHFHENVHMKMNAGWKEVFGRNEVANPAMGGISGCIGVPPVKPKAHINMKMNLHVCTNIQIHIKTNI